METRIAPVTLATDTEGVTKAASTGVRSSMYLLNKDNASSSVTFMACGIASGYSQSPPYAAFFCPALNFAHLARWNAEIFLRAAADMVRFTGAEPDVFVAPITTGCDSFRTLAHRALCASAIFRREAADTIRVGADVTPVGWLVVRDGPEPFNDTSSDIA